MGHDIYAAVHPLLTSTWWLSVTLPYEGTAWAADRVWDVNTRGVAATIAGGLFYFRALDLGFCGFYLRGEKLKGV